MSSLELIEVTKVYRDGDRELKIIEGLSFKFPEQGAVAIIGRSGVGKSTLLHLLAGLDTPTAGRVIFNAKDVHLGNAATRAKFRGQNVGFVFQFHNLLPEFSALENVAMPLIISGSTEKEAFNQAEQLLEKVGLASRSQHRPSRLSGGEQQRVAIARALIHKPGLVLADEPTGNLDPQSATLVVELLINCTKESSALLVIVTHSLTLARSLTHVLEMHPGGKISNLERVSEQSLVDL